MNWFPDQIDAAIIVDTMLLDIALIVALAAAIFAHRRLRRELNFEFAAEGAAHAMLSDRKIQYRTFRFLKYHLSGFADDELRKILVRAGGIRLTAGGQEVWGLLSRNRNYLSVEELNEVSATQLVSDTLGQKHNTPQAEIVPADESDPADDSSGAFARVRAEMIKLGRLECVRPAVRQE